MLSGNSRIGMPTCRRGHEAVRHKVRASRGDRRVDGRTGRCAALAVVCCLLAGLAWGLAVALAAGPSATPAGKTVLRVGWTGDPETLNPSSDRPAPRARSTISTYDFLTRYDRVTLTPRPGLATSWSHSPDGKTWTFTIRSGVKWQDGVPLTAARRRLHLQLHHQVQAAGVPGCTTASRRRRANDPTVVFTCSRGPRPTSCSMWVPILPQHIWGRSSTATPRPTTSPTSRPIVGSGPFQVVQWVHGQYVRCVANKSYWAARPRSTSSSSASTPTR